MFARFAAFDDGLMTLATVATPDDADIRRQTRCCLTVRLTWQTAAGEHHPDHTFTCAEDVEMAVTAATCAASLAPAGIRLIEAAVSATGGKGGPWEPLTLGTSA